MSSRSDPFAPLKENAWREAQAIDERLERGEIDEAEWHREWQALVVPAYLAAETPWGRSDKTGTAEDWECSRSHVADAIDADGSFLDVGWDRVFVGNALPWRAPHEFTYVRTGLGYVPPGRRQELLERLLGSCRRLVVGVFNEHESESTTEDELASRGYSVAGRRVRANRWKTGMEYRVLWIDT